MPKFLSQILLILTVQDRMRLMKMIMEKYYSL